MRDRSILTRLESEGRSVPQVDLLGGERRDDAGARYTVLGEIARGGMGAILKGLDRDIRRQVAMKVILSEGPLVGANVVRFIEEAQITAQLEHPNIVPVHDLDKDEGGNIYFTMKLVQGRSLGELLKEMRDAERSPSLRDGARHGEAG